MKGDGQIGRKRPGRRRPDEDRDVFPFKPGYFADRSEAIGKFHVDRGRRLVLIDDLGLGQSRLAVGHQWTGRFPLKTFPEAKNAAR